MGKKKVWVFLLILTLLLTACGQETASDQEIQKILGKDTLVVGTSADYPPYEFIKQVDGKDQYVGFDMDLARYIAQSWGVDLKIENVKFESLLTGLETGKYDMIIAGMSPDPDRKAEFSKIYYNATHGVLIQKDKADVIQKEEDLVDKEVGVQLGTIQEAIVDDMEGVHKKALANINTLILELKTGKVDALVMEKPVAESYVANNPDLMVVEDINIVDESGGSAIAIQEGNLPLLNAVNEVLEDVEEKDLMEAWVVEANNLVNDTGSTIDYTSIYGKGIKNTLLLSLYSVVIGFAIGLIVVFLRSVSFKPINWIARAYVEILRGTPLLVQILIAYYGLDLMGVGLSAFQASLIAVSLNSSAYISEIIRSGIESVDKGQTEAGRSLGLSKSQTMRKIVFPQAIKNILPALGNEFVALIKETSIASTIGVSELMFQTSKVQSITFEALKPLFIVSAIYFVLTFTISLVIKLFERKMGYDY